MGITYTSPGTSPGGPGDNGTTASKTPAEMMATLRPNSVFGDHSNPTPPTPPPPPTPTGPQGGGQGAFPGVQGAQYASPGAAGVTRYGLFANARGGPAPQPGPPRPAPPGGRPPLPRLPPQGPRLPPPSQVTGPVNDPAARARAELGKARSIGTSGMMTNRMGGGQGGGQGSLAKVNNDPRVLLNALQKSRPLQGGRPQQIVGDPRQPQQMQANQQPPPNQQNAGLQEQFDQQQQQAQASAADRNALEVSPSQLGLGGQWVADTFFPEDVDEEGNLDVGGATGQVAGEFGEAAGGALGEGFASFVDAWNAANPGSNMSYEDFLNMPGFEQSSIMGDVGQNWTAAMDPAAWEQMASNRLAAANEANTSALNRGERRLADRAGRTGFANTGGVTSQMYNDYAGRGMQAERDIFNDTLMNQMNALQGASGFALGQNAQDQSRWAQETALAGHAADQNFAANREDNPSGAGVLADLLGAGGEAAGMAGQAGGVLAQLLAALGMAGGM